LQLVTAETVILISGGLVVLFALSAFFSGSETAFFSLKPPLLRKWRRSGNERQRLAVRLMDQHHETLIAILFGTNLVNILISVLVARLAAGLEIGAGGPVLAGLVATTLLLFFGEVTPKTIAFGRAAEISERISPVINFVRTVLHPAVLTLRAVSQSFLTLFGAAPKPKPLSSDEFQTFISLGETMSAFTPREADLLRETFALRAKTVAGAMIPRIDVCSVDAQLAPAELEEAIRKFRHRRLVVINDDLDDLVGILDVRSYFRLTRGQQSEWRKRCVREAIFVPEHASMEKAMQTLRTSRAGMVMVVDEYGGIAGVLTLEDLLEEIVGEMVDEYDEPTWKASKIRAGWWRFSGLVPLHELEDVVPFKEPEETMADTAGGLIAEALGRLPEAGDEIVEGGLRFVVRRVTHRRVTEMDVFLIDEGVEVQP
jgi:putative hemolysin